MRLGARYSGFASTGEPARRREATCRKFPSQYVVIGLAKTTLFGVSAAQSRGLELVTRKPVHGALRQQRLPAQCETKFRQ
jgi:hypothetical protein